MTSLKTDVNLKSRYRGKKVNGKKIDEHRYVMQMVLGRPLNSDEIVHHKDGNKMNNDPSNLEVMTRSQHSKMHMLGYKPTASTLAKQREAGKAMWKRGSCDNLKFKVYAYDKMTGELVAVYESTRAAAADGYASSHISDCCRGKRHSYRGRIWKYADIT